MVNEATASDFFSTLEARGVTRRSFMKLCGTVAVAAGLSELAAPHRAGGSGVQASSALAARTAPRPAARLTWSCSKLVCFCIAL